MILEYSSEEYSSTPKGYSRDSAQVVVCRRQKIFQEPKYFD